MTIKTLVSALALAAALSAAGAAPAAPALRSAQTAVATISGAERARILKAASQALNAQTRLEGRFVQVAGDGSTSGGRFWLQRPGKLRFEYDAPSPLTVVSDGQTLAIQDRALKTVDRAPLRSTPLYFVLKNNIDLERDVRVTQVARQGALISVAARDRSGEADGQVVLVFEGPNYQLKRWRIIDGQGAATDLSLQQTRVAARIDPALFVSPAAATPIRGSSNR